jgi:hypothetical protein
MKIDETEEITLSTLIAAFTEELLASARDEKEAGRVAANILTDFLHNAEPISKCWHLI